MQIDDTITYQMIYLGLLYLLIWQKYYWLNGVPFFLRRAVEVSPDQRFHCIEAFHGLEVSLYGGIP